MKEQQLHEILVSLGIKQIIKRGHNLMGCCPSHGERRPSWGISVNDPHFHGCFSCGYKGTLRTLLLDQGWSLSKVERVVGDAPKEDKGLVWEESSAEASGLPEMDETLLFPFLPKHKVLSEFVTRRKIEPALAKKVGLLFDKKRSRVVFPWYWGKRLLGATGRSMIDDEPNKIIAYGSFKKSRALYVPARTLSPVNPVVLVEGETDAIKVMQAGFSNVAALGYGSFSAHQVKLLEILPVKSVILFFDNDKRGAELMGIAAQELMGVCPIKCVDYGFRTTKDPGDLALPAIRNMINGAVVKVSWPEFSY